MSFSTPSPPSLSPPLNLKTLVSPSHTIDFLSRLEEERREKKIEEQNREKESSDQFYQPFDAKHEVFGSTINTQLQDIPNFYSVLKGYYCKIY